MENSKPETEVYIRITSVVQVLIRSGIKRPPDSTTGDTSGQMNSRVSSRSGQADLRVDSRELEVDRRMDRRVLRVVK